MAGQRVHARHARKLAVTIVHEDHEYEGVTRNLSLGGLYMFTDARLPFGTDIQVRLELPALDRPAILPAVVRWQKPDGVGVQFGQLRARDVWALNELFASPPEVAALHISSLPPKE